MMTERENALHTIYHDGKAEWIPAGCDCMEMIILTNVLRECPPYLLGMEGSGYDYWGCWWEFEADIMGGSPLPGRQPCKDITKWREQVKFPDINAIDWSGAELFTSRLDRENKLSMLFWESGPFERLHALVGFENALIAMHEEPEAFKELMQAITDFRISLLPLIKEHYNPDIIINLDDFGYQRSAFMSRELFRELILPYEKQFGDAIKANGMIYCHHSCGKIDGLMDEIVEMGPQMILGLFAPYNDQETVVKKYGDRLVFIGATNAQLVDMPDTTEEQLRAEARRYKKMFAPTQSMIFDPGTMNPVKAGPMNEEFKKIRSQYLMPSRNSRPQ